MTTEAVEEVEPTGEYERGGVGRARYKRAETVVTAIVADAQRRKRREVATALDELEAHGGLGDGQRDAVERMADAIVGRVLAAPLATVRGTADRTTARTARRLFVPGGTTERRARGRVEPPGGGR
ncbi:hypothetical protein [Halomarina ordinaria]|uniref:Tetrapyrrole biosynthesis glutamyl-tRNA reductase dimerisation domain-containing protein n=1 Tax=Halomarina ordinaria TaxID=3033939 RepID=A0ABD5UF33_9EURY|nr:hypothetical protein [Halomarina sp. PSRA2]